VSLVWVVPFVVLLVGAAAVVALLRGTVDCARELGMEIARFGELHASVARVRAEFHETDQRLRAVKGRGRHR
jgi:cytochrome c-type biogenesis protein CcmH/NrfF